MDVANVQDDLLQRLKEDTRISADRKDAVLKEVDGQILDLTTVRRNNYKDQWFTFLNRTNVFLSSSYTTFMLTQVDTTTLDCKLCTLPTIATYLISRLHGNR